MEPVPTSWMQVVLEVVKQVPSLAVLCWVVWVFVRALARFTGAAQQTAHECHKTHEAIADRYDARMAETNEALRQSASALAIDGERRRVSDQLAVARERRRRPPTDTQPIVIVPGGG